MTKRGGIIIIITLLLAMLLLILPLPDWARPYRPQWVTLTLIYWCIALPHRVSVGSGFTVGIILDALTGTLLGMHALGLSLVAFLAVQLHARIRVFPLWQQAFVVLILLIIEHLLTLWILRATDQSIPGSQYWLIPAIGAALWPWVFVTLRDIRRHFKVS